MEQHCLTSIFLSTFLWPIKLLPHFPTSLLFSQSMFLSCLTKFLCLTQKHVCNLVFTTFCSVWCVVRLVFSIHFTCLYHLNWPFIPLRTFLCSFLHVFFCMIKCNIYCTIKLLLWTLPNNNHFSVPNIF